jgi:hypothetical protein
MKNGLIAIYLSDSYFKGKLTRTGCEGHTNNTGDNGAGKTTSLNLIPVFYGLSPDKLIQKAGSKKSFLDFYLPRYQSMVVFEYIRMGQICCAVLYKKSDKSFAYRFVKGAADETLFNNEAKLRLKECKEAKTWLKDYVFAETLVSKQIDTTLDYRAIIQNDPKRLKVRRSKGASLSSDAYEFSLCSPETYMQHIESLTSVLMKHDRLLEQFKTMVVDSFLVEQLDIGAVPFNKKNGELINDLKSLLELNKHNEKFSKSISEYNNLNEVWGRLISYKSQLKSLLAECNEEITVKSKDKGALEQDLTEKHDLYIRKRDLLNESLSANRIELKTVKEHLDSLYLKRTKWDEENISQKEAELEQLEDYRNEFKVASEHYDNLLKSVKKEKDEHELNKLKVNEKAGRKVQELKDKIHLIETELHSSEKKSNDKINALEKERIEDQERYKNSMESQKSVLQDKLVDARVSSQMATNLADEEMHSSNSQQKKLTEIEINLEEHEDKLELVQEELKIKVKDRENLLGSYLKKKKHVDSLQSKLDDITRQLYPLPGSLKEFLNSSGLAWRENIGKVILPELLLSTKLSPEIYAEENFENLFGISIELEKLPAQESALSDQVLSEQLETIKLDLSIANDEIKQVENLLKNINEETKYCEESLQEINRQVKHIKEDRNRLRSFIETQKELYKSNGQQRLKEAEAAKVKVDEDIKQLELTVNNSIADIALKFHELTLSEKEKFSFEEEKALQSKDVITANIVNVNETSKKQCVDLEKLFKSLLSDLNIDTKMESDAKKLKIQSLEKLERVESYRGLVNEYKSWEKVEWSRLDGFNHRDNIVSAEVNKFEQELESNQKDFGHTKASLESGISSLTDQVIALKQSEETAQGCLSNIGAQLELAPVDVQPLEVDEAEVPIILFESVNDSVTEALRLKRSIIKVVKNVVSFLSQTNNKTKINELWLQLYDSRKELSKYEPHEEEFFLESIQDIATLIDTSIPDITSITIESIRSVGEQVIRFYQSLDSLNRKVNSVSNTLANNINTQHEFPAIGNIEISLVSKINEYDVWKDLKNFSASWSSWQELERGQLPTNDFLNSFAAVIDSLRVSKVTSDIASLVEINISLEENGRLVNIRNDNDLKNVSSTGISMLAVIVVFCGMTRYLCRDENVKIHWPLDELGKLSTQNTTLLFKFMDKHNIALFCAQPNPPSVLRKYFTTKNHLVKDEGVFRYTDWKSKKKNPLINNVEQLTASSEQAEGVIS